MKNIGFVVMTLATVIVLAVAFTNGASVPFNLFGTQTAVPESALVVAGYVVGVASAFSLLVGRYSAKTASSQKLLEWQAQDDKLLGQVQSDREKQLEAKIATLEAALQRALKK